MISAFILGTTTDESVGMHLIHDLSTLFYTQYNWCIEFGHAIKPEGTFSSIPIYPNHPHNTISSMLAAFFCQNN